MLAADAVSAGLVLAVRLGVCYGGEGAVPWGGGNFSAWANGSDAASEDSKEGTNVASGDREEVAGGEGQGSCVQGGGGRGYGRCACAEGRYVGEAAVVKVRDTGGWERFEELRAGVVSARVPASLVRRQHERRRARERACRASGLGDGDVGRGAGDDRQGGVGANMEGCSAVQVGENGDDRHLEARCCGPAVWCV